PLKAMLPGAPGVAELGTEADTSEALAHSAVAMAKSTEAKDAKAVNVSQTAHVKRGDVAKGFAESDVVLEHTYRIPMVHQGYIEPHAVLAEWDRNGQLTLWASTQGSFNTRSEVADVLGIDENRVKVIPVECGGGFGGLYKWPAFDIKGTEVLTHKPSVAAYRAPVAPHTIFAIDSHMEQLARALDLDPGEFRARHLSRPGDPMVNNQPWASMGAHEVLARAVEHPFWKERAAWKAS